MSKKNIFDLLDVPEDIGGEISENCPKTDTDRTEALIRSAVGGTGAAPAKKRPVRRRFMIGLVAAVVSASVIGGAVAVIAQNNGNYVEPEPLTPQESYEKEMRSHGNNPGKKYAIFKNEFENEVREEGRALFYKKNGYHFDEVGSENITDEMLTDLEMQEAFYKEKCYNDLLTKLVDDGYGDPIIIPDAPAHDYFDFADEHWAYVQDLDKYSDMIIVFCNAYNDPDYEMTERDRMLTFMYLDNGYNNIRNQARLDNRYTDKMRQAYELIEKTIVPIMGYVELQTS